MHYKVILREIHRFVRRQKMTTWPGVNTPLRPTVFRASSAESVVPTTPVTAPFQAVTTSTISSQPAPTSTTPTQPAVESTIPVQTAPASTIPTQPAPTSTLFTQPAPISTSLSEPESSSTIPTQPSPSSTLLTQPSPTTIMTSLTRNPMPTFIPPESCSDKEYTLAPDGSDLYDPVSSIAAKAPRAGCFPEVADLANIVLNRTTAELVTFSPGRCPGGYATNYLNTASQNTNASLAICCPTPLTLSTNSLNVTTCAEDGLGADMVTLVDGSQTTTALAQILQAYPIIVMWESSDNAYLDTLPSTTAEPGAGVATPTSQPTGASTNTGLSIAAQAGIGVGVAVGGIILMVLGLLLWRRRQKGAGRDSSSEEGSEKPELQGEGVHRELAGEDIIYEKHGVNKPAEIHNDIPSELDANWRGWEAPAVVEVDLSGNNPQNRRV